MKEFLNYYYYLLPERIHKIDNVYYFQVNNNYFSFCPYNGNINDLQSLYILNNYMSYQSNKINRIIINKEGKIYTIKNNIIYVLILLKTTSKEIIDVNTIIKFLSIYSYVDILNHSNWYLLWCNKIDYLENIRNNLKKEDYIIYNSLPYYIGLTENAISYLKYLNIDNNDVGICHKRINCKETVKDLYSPLNLVIDYKVRDLAEYYKSLFFKTNNNNLIIKSFEMLNINYINKIYFYIRMLYPSFYFDILDEVLKGSLKQEKLLNITRLSENYEYLLYQLYLIIKKHGNIPEIEWINKKFAHK